MSNKLFNSEYRNSRLVVMMTATEKENLIRIAKQDGVTISDVVRMLVYLEDKQRQSDDKKMDQLRQSR